MIQKKVTPMKARQIVWAQNKIIFNGKTKPSPKLNDPEKIKELRLLDIQLIEAHMPTMTGEEMGRAKATIKAIEIDIGVYGGNDSWK